MQESITGGADSLLTVKEVAARLRTSAATVYGLCASGRLAHERISTHGIRIRASDLGDFVVACRAGR
jgi:excisionase family DNA binding protein